MVSVILKIKTVKHAAKLNDFLSWTFKNIPDSNDRVFEHRQTSDKQLRV